MAFTVIASGSEDSLRHGPPRNRRLATIFRVRPHVAELAAVSTTYVSSYPNAGLPNAFGEYDEQPSYEVEFSALSERSCNLHNTSGRQLLLTAARTTRARSLATALDPFLPGLVAPPCELVRYTLPTAKVDLVRRLSIKGCMRKDFVVFAHVPTY